LLPYKIQNYAISLIVLTVFTHFVLCGHSRETGSFTDPRDGKTYRTVKIAGKWWMAQNLNYESEKGSWCIEGDSNGSRFGRFYNWLAAKEASPPGWHLPSKKEYKTLLDTLGQSRKEQYQKLIKDGESGFDALLLGSHMGKYGKMGRSAHFWSSTLWWFSSLLRITENPWRLCLRKADYVNIGHFAESSCGFNVRCVKDE
jgi:uncharacterized protein (TIGR02145 family)